MKVCSLKPLMFVDEMVCTSICLNVRIELFSLGILTWNATHASDSVAWNSFFFLCVCGGMGFSGGEKVCTSERFISYTNLGV